MKLIEVVARRPGRVAISAVAAIAVTGGIAYASIPDSGGVIHACSLNNVGTIRLIDTAKSGLQGHCSNIETQVTWNQKGQTGAAGVKGDKGDAGAPGAKGADGAPGAKGDTGAQGAAGAPGAKGDTGAQGAAGAPGAKGDTGAPGASGATGYQVITASTGIPAGIEITGTLPCPTGKRATGGGWTTENNDFNVRVIGSGPTADGGGWTGGMYNGGTTSDTLTLSVTCITVPDSASLAQSQAKAARKPVFTRVEN